MRYLLTLLFLMFPGEAFSFCSSPSIWESAPSPPSTFSKPDVPYCLNSYSYSREHTCDQWELDSYFDEVAEYVEDLETYHREAVAFANAAIEFSNQALAYAKCEAEDVGSQHE